MSFLAPLYLLGIATIAGPIVFHLIRRTPRGQMLFSSLMFLSPSPPRLTRRSRIDNLLLLLLRIAALILLALAFSRPFMRQAAQLNVSGIAGNRVAILLDTSASMQREDLWQQAVAQAERSINELEPTDDVALISFDNEVKVVVSFEATAELEPREKKILLRDSLGELKPSFQSTDIPLALSTTADMLDVSTKGESDQLDPSLQIVLISDAQRGSGLDYLQDYRWPESVRVSMKRIEPDSTSNASLRLVNVAQSVSVDESNRRRVRVNNAEDSNAQQFDVQWTLDSNFADAPVEVSPDDSLRNESASTNVASLNLDPRDVQVPPGEIRVIKIDTPETGIRGLELTRDDHDFDNLFYVATPPVQEWNIGFLGSIPLRETDGLRYFLQIALPSDAQRNFTLDTFADDEPWILGLDSDANSNSNANSNANANDNDKPDLVVVGKPTTEDQSKQLSEYLSRGGKVVLVLTGEDMEPALQQLSGDDEMTLSEAAVRDYALIGQVDFQSPLFAPFADPRFNDFTRAHFWKYRKVSGDEEENFASLASFNDGSPFIMHRRVDEGELYVFTSGWHPEDSQFAMSSKFVPIMMNIIHSGRARQIQTTFVVGETVDLEEFQLDKSTTKIHQPNGTVTLMADDNYQFDETNEPGIYQIETPDQTHHFAVNLAASESETTPLEIEQMEKFGVLFASNVSKAELVDRERQLRRYRIGKTTTTLALAHRCGTDHPFDRNLLRRIFGEEDRTLPLSAG